MKDLGVIIEYEEILLGNRSLFSKDYTNKKNNATIMYDVLRYAFEDLLHWTPFQVRDYFNQEIGSLLKLEKPISRIEYCPELDKRTDHFYIAWILYPETIHISKKDLVISVYEKILRRKKRKYPKNFFLNSNGETNKKICFQYAINQFLEKRTLKDLYLFFANEEQAIKFLKKYKLYKCLFPFYETPLEMFHDMLDEGQRNEMFYFYSKFSNELEQTKKILSEQEEGGDVCED